jgi:hypothetical protein
MLDLGLRWVREKSDMGEKPCGVCDVPFEAGAFQVQVLYQDDIPDDMPVCPTCIEYLGQRNPVRYPTIEEYEEAKQRYLEPIFDYEPDDYTWTNAYWTSWIKRKDFTPMSETNT